mmetsp:Transcript_39026/g.78032  ORF Transcript_39026/g.78032 Transcript_39026/m.78032 type:complete len:155 (+) Transcript_39026:371-835(+)
MDDVGRFAREGYDGYGGCDVEAAACADLCPPLAELPLNFPPTYAYGPMGAASSETLPAFSAKRCPSWCGRVLLNAAGMRLLRGGSVDDVVYASEPQAVVHNDHNLVSLAFSPGVLSTDPLGVRVAAKDKGAATVAKPAPWRVKSVTEVVVGAGT